MASSTAITSPGASAILVRRSDADGMRVAPCHLMHTTTKLFALGAVGAAAYGASRLMRQRVRPTHIDARFDRSDVHDTSDVQDVDDAIIITEEVIVITDADYDVDIDLIPSDDPRVRRS